jgi:uncharacterized protein YehS (DUF1456 family)
MVANDVLKKLRYILSFDDQRILKVFELGGVSVSEEQVKSWLAKDDSEDFMECEHRPLAAFLNGLIIEKRGPREGDSPKPEVKLTNNMILRKLMIAYSLKTDDVVEILKLADLRVGKSEISAFFRKSDHRNYRECKSQVLRNFLMGIQLKQK